MIHVTQKLHHLSHRPSADRVRPARRPPPRGRLGYIMCHIVCQGDAVSVVAFPGPSTPPADPVTGATTGSPIEAVVERFLEPVQAATTRAGYA